MADLSRPDLCIVGAGALGIALARHARRLGASVVLVDRGRPEMGDQPGIQRRFGALAASAGLAQALREGARLGLANAEPKISYRSLEERAGAVAAASAVLESPEHLAAQQIHVVRGPARFDGPRALLVGDTQLRPRAIVLATGGLPLVPPLPGLEEIAFFDADSIFANNRKLTHLLVIGGGPEAVALAQMQQRLGAAVTLVPQGNLLPEFDPEAVAILVSTLRDEGMDVLEGASVTAIMPRSQGTGIVVAGADGAETGLDVSHVLVAMGRVPDLAGLDIEKLRLNPLPGGGIAVGRLGQTGSRAVRAVGLAAGLSDWAAALAHGRACLETLLLGAPLRPLGPLPLFVPAAPALAQIGRLPRPGQAASAGTRLLRANTSENAAARALGTTEGMVKVLVDVRGRLLGASLVGPGAGDIAAILALAMEKGIGLDALAGLALPQSSLATTIAALVEGHEVASAPSAWTQRRRALRQLLPW
jgi:pyruvate/2-oxoglutarate dehydrogenase complex dihydrolipoamide dehydrogenase (E3) component